MTCDLSSSNFLSSNWDRALFLLKAPALDPEIDDVSDIEEVESDARDFFTAVRRSRPCIAGFILVSCARAAGSSSETHVPHGPRALKLMMMMPKKQYQML